MSEPWEIVTSPGLPPSVSRLSMLLPPSYIPLFSRVSEPEIKEYLRRVLGSEAPQPEWGLPDGWGAYLAGEMGYIYFGRRCGVPSSTQL